LFCIDYAIRNFKNHIDLINSLERIKENKESGLVEKTQTSYLN